MTTTNVLPASDVINVTLTSTPSGLTVKNVNSLALFTQDAPLNLEKFGVYISPSQAASNYGTNSKTAKMVNAIFAQVPNILTGTGRLVIIPMIGAVSATHGNVVTPNIEGNLATIIGVTNGDLKLTISGVVTNVGNLNFSNCVTLADIAAVLQDSIQDCIVTATATGLQFTNKRVGAVSTAALGMYAGGGTDLSGAGYFNAAAEVATAGVNSSGETIPAAIARTSGLVGYVPFMSTMDIEDAAVQANSNAVQALDNLYFQHFASTQDIAGIISTIQQAGNNKTRCLLYTASQNAANLYKAAYAGRGCSVDFTGSDTVQTMNLKQLATITPDTGISQTLYAECMTAGADIYVSYDGVPSVVSEGANLFFDQPYCRLAYKFALQVGGFNYLRQTNTKVPQTEPGMDGLKDAYDIVNDQFVENGYLAPGAWNSSETFGNQLIFLNNITQNGYYTYSQPIAQQDAPDRDARVAPLVQIAAKESGAIQSGNVLVIVNP